MLQSELIDYVKCIVWFKECTECSIFSKCNDNSCSIVMTMSIDTNVSITRMTTNDWWKVYMQLQGVVSMNGVRHTCLWLNIKCSGHMLDWDMRELKLSESIVIVRVIYD